MAPPSQPEVADIEDLPIRVESALLAIAYGQILRRAGQRRAAASQLQVARDRLSTLNARPFLEQCDRELAACGLAPAKRTEFDPSRLTAQESAVARLVSTGMGNRQVAAELFVSIKTVQFHLTHIYAKLGISSRGELAAQFRDHGADSTTNERGRERRSSASPKEKGPESPVLNHLTLSAQECEETDRRLTPQESAVAGLMAEGFTDRQIAKVLFIAIPTVEFHRNHVLAKLAASTRAELIAHISGVVR